MRDATVAPAVTRQAETAPRPLRPGRALFALDPGTVWFNGGYNAPLPAAARAGVEQALAIQLAPDRIGPNAVREVPDGLRIRLGRLLGLPSDEIGITHSAVYAALLLSHAIDWSPGDRILIAADEFPANLYPWLALEGRGVRCERIGGSGGPITPEALDAAFDRRGRVRALAVAATHYATGALHPLAPLAERLHARGAWMFVDATQAAGAVAIDWRTVGADALFMSGYKWLLGPYGTGALWVSPALQPAVARANGNWWALEASQDIDRVMREWPREFERNGRALDAGQSASYLNLGAWSAALDVLAAVGIPTAEAHLRVLQDAIVASIADTPLAPAAALDVPHRSPLLQLTGPVDIVATQAGLAQRGVYVSARSGRLRVSPGVWNEPADVERFARALHDVLNGKSS